MITRHSDSVLQRIIQTSRVQVEDGSQTEENRCHQRQSERKTEHSKIDRYVAGIGQNSSGNISKRRGAPGSQHQSANSSRQSQNQSLGEQQSSKLARIRS